MRISSTTFFTATLAGIRAQQGDISRISQQLATNQRLLAPKDDPVATSQILSLGESIASRTQFMANQQKAQIALNQESTLLAELRDTLVKARAVIAEGRTANDQTLRDENATTLAGYYQHIKDLLNYQDVNGDYVFAGHETATQPYSHTPAYNPASPGGAADSPDAAYNGDGGQRRIEIDRGRFVASNDDLNTIFQAGVADSTAAPLDVLELLDQAAIDLHDSATSLATLQANLDAAYNAVSTALTGLQVTQAAVAGRLVEINEARQSTEQYLLFERNSLGSLTEVDQAAAIVALQQRQVSLQAAESAFSLTSKLTIFNFL
jgi:flagellar hook-associated protein 3 FlgL